jgi:hypothetical protein
VGSKLKKMGRSKVFIDSGKKEPIDRILLTDSRTYSCGTSVIPAKRGSN